jgi:hypothetical protein
VCLKARIVVVKASACRVTSWESENGSRERGNEGLALRAQPFMFLMPGQGRKSSFRLSRRAVSEIRGRVRVIMVEMAWHAFRDTPLFVDSRLCDLLQYGKLGRFCQLVIPLHRIH